MRRSLRNKWKPVALFWLAQAAIAYFLWPLMGFGEDIFGPLVYAYVDYMLWMAPIIGSVMVLQAVFLLPVRRPRAHGAGRLGRILHFGLSGLAVGIMAGVVATVVTVLADWVGLLDPIGEFLQEWVPWQVVFWAPLLITWPIASILLARRCRRRTPLMLSMAIAGLSAGLLLGGIVLGAASAAELLGWRAGEDDLWYSAVALVLLSWPVGTLLLWSFARHRPPEAALSRIASRLFVGTIVEAAAIIPLDVMVRRKSDCYCGEGTFWALSACWAIGFLVLGPAIWLLPLSRRRRRLYLGRCVACGYDMSGCRDADRCPECGAGWRAAAGP